MCERGNYHIQVSLSFIQHRKHWNSKRSIFQLFVSNSHIIFRLKDPISLVQVIFRWTRQSSLHNSRSMVFPHQEVIIRQVCWRKIAWRLNNMRSCNALAHVEFEQISLYLMDMGGCWYKVDLPTLVFHLKWTPTFELCMVGCQSKIGHQKRHVWKYIRLCVQNLISIRVICEVLQIGMGPWDEIEMKFSN